MTACRNGVSNDRSKEPRSNTCLCLPLNPSNQAMSTVFPGAAFGLFETRVRDYAFAEAQAQLQQAAPEPTS